MRWGWGGGGAAGEGETAAVGCGAGEEKRRADERERADERAVPTAPQILRPASQAGSSGPEKPKRQRPCL